MRIHLVQLEPLKERYTSWWETYIPEHLRTEGHTVFPVTAETLTQKVHTGTVLDANGTNYYKAQQIQEIARRFNDKEIAPGDCFLIADIWFPGIEAIKYMSDLNKIPVKIYGVWHAGSITNEDFMQPSHTWAKYFELGFLSICDGVFVGTEYAKESIMYKLLVYSEDAQEIANKIHAKGMPLDTDMLGAIEVEKKPIILFPNRFDIEKRPNIFLDAIAQLSVIYNPVNEVEIVFCTSRETLSSNTPWILDKLEFVKNALEGTKFKVRVESNLSKKAYYELLASASCMVSTTIEENFGYCLAEALAVGTVPIVPNAFSHPEILDGRREYLYDNFDELVLMMKKNISLWDNDTSKLEEVKPQLKQMVRNYRDTVWSWQDIMNKP